MDPTLETILCAANAKNAYEKLVGLRMRLDVLEFWLHAIGEMSNDVPKAINYNRAKFVKLVKKCRVLATEVEGAFESGNAPRMVDPATIPRVLSLTNELRAVADVLEQSIPEPNDNPRVTSEHADGIIDLLTAVEYFTGSFHYEEVAELLNSVDVAYERSSTGRVWDVTQLRQRRYRYYAQLKKRYPGRTQG